LKRKSVQGEGMSVAMAEIPAIADDRLLLRLVL